MSSIQCPRCGHTLCQRFFPSLALIALGVVLGFGISFCFLIASLIYRDRSKDNSDTPLAPYLAIAVKYDLAADQLDSFAENRKTAQACRGVLQTIYADVWDAPPMWSQDISCDVPGYVQANQEDKIAFAKQTPECKLVLLVDEAQIALIHCINALRRNGAERQRSSELISVLRTGFRKRAKEIRGIVEQQIAEKAKKQVRAFSSPAFSPPGLLEDWPTPDPHELWKLGR